MQNYAIADAKIQNVNSNPENTWTAAHNQFSTMSQIELDTYFSKSWGPQQEETLEVEETFEATDDLNETGIDWRTSGVIGPVRNEGTCGASWAIAPVDAIQATYASQYHKKYILSEQ
jgi:hypothetical protein